MKIKNSFFFFFFFFGGGGGRVRGRVGLGGQGRCEQSSEVFVKNYKKMWGGFRSGGGGLGRGVGGLDGGVRVDVNEVFVKIPPPQKKFFFLGGGGGRVGVGWGGWGR